MQIVAISFSKKHFRFIWVWIGCIDYIQLQIRVQLWFDSRALIRFSLDERRTTTETNWNACTLIINSYISSLLNPWCLSHCAAVVLSCLVFSWCLFLSWSFLSPVSCLLSHLGLSTWRETVRFHCSRCNGWLTPPRPQKRDASLCVPRHAESPQNVTWPLQAFRELPNRTTQ